VFEERGGRLGPELRAEPPQTLQAVHRFVVFHDTQVGPRPAKVLSPRRNLDVSGS